jgi:hypothetical protein
MDTQPPTTSRGHEEPFAVQFSIFLANRVGQLRELLDVFDAKQLRMLGISLFDSADWAVIRVVFQDPDKARSVLEDRGVSFTESDILLIELTDDDTLAEMCSHLMGAELNIHVAFPLTLRNHGNAVMVLHVDDRVLAAHVLTRHNFVLLGHEDLADPT